MSALIAAHYLERAERHEHYGEKRMARAYLTDAAAALRHADPEEHADLHERWQALNRKLREGRA